MACRNPAMTDLVAINSAAALTEQEAKQEADLEADLSALSEVGAQHFDPVRFHIIATMVDKSSRLRDAAAAGLRQRASHKLLAYQADMKRAQQFAQPHLETIDSLFPEYREAAAQLLAHADIRALASLLEELQGQPGGTPLGQLCRQLQSDESQPRGETTGSSPGDYLRQQELELTGGVSPGNATAYSNRPVPLKSAQLCRDALTQLQAEHLVKQASRAVPEDSGPLNPHKLALRSLTTLREISPGYLGRLVSYLDTLSWLESN
jgi:hypothetical protein